MIGGALAKPCDNFPGLFPRNTIWDRFPYLLPNLFSAFICLVGVLNGLLFLKETHYERQKQRDRGLEIGEWILRKATSLKAMFSRCDSGEPVNGGSLEREPLLAHAHTHQRAHGEQLPGYQSTAGSPCGSPQMHTAVTPNEMREPLDLAASSPYVEELPQKKFSRAILLNIATFGILAL
jgi:hypothetical protein